MHTTPTKATTSNQTPSQSLAPTLKPERIDALLIRIPLSYNDLTDEKGRDCNRNTKLLRWPGLNCLIALIYSTRRRDFYNEAPIGLRVGTPFASSAASRFIDEPSHDPYAIRACRR
jgi:hypothetical protein